MDKLLLRVVAGLAHNTKAAEFFLHRDFPLKIFYDDTGKSPIPYGEKEAFFLAKCAITYFEKHAEKVTQSYIAKMLAKVSKSKARLADYKKIWVALSKHKTIKVGEWKELLESLIHQYREFRHKDLFYQIAAIYEKTCFGNYMKADSCKECTLRQQCKLMDKSGEKDKSIWVVDWSSAMTEEIKIDTRGTHIRVYEVADLIKSGAADLDIGRKVSEKNKHGILMPYPSVLPTGKWMPGRLYFLASRTKVGKSAALLQCANVAASAGHPVLYFNLEMPVKEELRYRIISYLTGADFGDIMSLNVDDKLMGMIDAGVDDWLGTITNSENYQIVDIPLQTKLQTIYRHIDNFVARVGRHDILVVIDYFNLLYCPVTDSGARSVFLGELSGDLHSYARANGYVMLSALQLNRSSEGARRITPRHLRDSDKILDNCDGAWAMVPLSDEYLLFQNIAARYFRPKDTTLKKCLERMAFIEMVKGENQIEDYDDEEFDL